MRHLAAAAVVIALATPAHAGMQTQRVADLCRASAWHCTAVLAVAVDALIESRAFCPVEGFTYEQARAVFEREATERPERGHENAADVLRESLAAAFPCAQRTLTLEQAKATPGAISLDEMQRRIARASQEPVRLQQPTAIDGDSLIATVHLRLNGIDAPELRQMCERAGECRPCGQEAAETMTRLIQGKTELAGRLDGSVTYGRPVAVIESDSADLAIGMLIAGQAVAAPQYISDPEQRASYLEAEQIAREQKRGLWSGRFDMPTDWRKGDRTVCDPLQ